MVFPELQGSRRRLHHRRHPARVHIAPGEQEQVQEEGEQEQKCHKYNERLLVVKKKKCRKKESSLREMKKTSRTRRGVELANIASNALVSLFFLPGTSSRMAVIQLINLGITQVLVKLLINLQHADTITNEMLTQDVLCILGQVIPVSFRRSMPIFFLFLYFYVREIKLHLHFINEVKLM